MHVCLVCTNDFVSDARARATRHVLATAGNQVTVLASGQPAAGSLEGDIRWVATRRPAGMGAVGSALRRAQPDPIRQKVMDRALAAAASGVAADNYQVISGRALPAAISAAETTGATISRWPALPMAGRRDLIDLAPHHPELSRSPAGGSGFITPADTRSPYRPRPGRHTGRITLCFRKTDSNPGKYLEAALRRSGLEVDLHTDSVDLANLPAGTRAVVFVEGPYPPISTQGTAGVPVFYWTHHGEHHLFANLRLARRYAADAVLLAHSWHMTHWFPIPVHRFPFGVATELLDPSRPLADRTFDVAIVGAKLRGGGPYGRRQQLVAELEAALPGERLGFAEKVSAAEMADLYADSRIIINEGGLRHYPITMRVLEAVGAGAVLLTDDLPGTDLLLEPETHYARLGPDVVSDTRNLLADPDRMQRMADAALDHALGLHTYDHRVDDLIAIIETTAKHPWGAPPELSPLAAAIDADPEVQRVAQSGAPELGPELASRELWEAERLAPRRLGPGKMEAVAVRADDLAGYEELLAAARRYLYLEGAARGLEGFLAAHHPQAVTVRHGDVTRVDLMAESYRVLPHEVIGG